MALSLQPQSPPSPCARYAHIGLARVVDYRKQSATAIDQSAHAAHPKSWIASMMVELPHDGPKPSPVKGSMENIKKITAVAARGVVHPMLIEAMRAGAHQQGPAF